MHAFSNRFRAAMIMGVEIIGINGQRLCAVGLSLSPTTDYRSLITDHRSAIGFPPSSFRVIAG